MADKINIKNSIHINTNIQHIEPWNSKEFPVKVNNIRYNQNNTLFTLATSRGYKIFSTKNLLQVQEETDIVRDLGDLDIVMTYYESSLVFFISTSFNEKISNNELIIFDDLYQKKFISFKAKKEKIKNFYVGKYMLFIITKTQIIIIELISFKIVKIIYNIDSDNKLLSFNNYGFLAFTKLDEKNKIYIKIFNVGKNKNKIESIRNRIITPNFDSIQSIQLSPSGQLIAISSFFGNKIHVYYIENLILKECFYIGEQINYIHQMNFCFRGECFLLILFNNKFIIYEMSKILEGMYKCKCVKYKEVDMIKQMIHKKENEKNWFNFLDKINEYYFPNINQTIDNPLISFDLKSEILFLDFVDIENNNNELKEICLIYKNGEYDKYSFKQGVFNFNYNNNYAFKNNPYIPNNNNLTLMQSIQWI